MSYTKLFSHIVTSSIWSEDDQTRILWITMLALSDKHGEVMASIPGLAKVAGLSIESTKAGLEKFMSPDPYSRTPDDEGRRIEPVDGGWLIINYAKHRRMASLDEQREKNAARQKRFRERKSANSNASSRKVTKASRASNGAVTLETDNAEAEAEAERTSKGSSKENARWDELLKTYREAGVDVVKEERDARAWVLSHPGRKFTLDFFRNWLKRTAEKLPPRKPKEELVVTEYQGPTAETFLRK